MPDVRNSAFAQFETSDTTIKSAAKITAGPSSSGLVAKRCALEGPAFFSTAEALPSRYCRAQITKPANERQQSQGASTRARPKLKNATTARMRKYMIAVASVMPACACWRVTAPVLASRAKTTVVAVEE